MEKFIFGVALGGLAGALLTANNYKMRTIVKKSQEEVQAKLDQFMDDKIEDLEKGTEKIKQTVKDKADEILDKAEEKLDALFGGASVFSSKNFPKLLLISSSLLWPMKNAKLLGVRYRLSAR